MAVKKTDKHKAQISFCCVIDMSIQTSSTEFILFIILSVCFFI